MATNIYSTHALLVIHFWLAHRLLSLYLSIVYQPTCTTLGLTHAHNQTNRVSGVDSTSLWGGPEWHTHWVCNPVSQCPIPGNEHQTQCKPCTKQNSWNQSDSTYTSGPLCTIKQRGVCLHWRLLVLGGYSFPSFLRFSATYNVSRMHKALKLLHFKISSGTCFSLSLAKWSLQHFLQSSKFVAAHLVDVP